MSKTTKQGTIIRKIGDRTAVVETFRMKIHPLYKKRFKVVKKYLADDKDNNFKEGDIVMIEETKPISKKKKFIVREKIGEKHLVKKEELKGEEILEKKEEDEKEEKVDEKKRESGGEKELDKEKKEE